MESRYVWPSSGAEDARPPEFIRLRGRIKAENKDVLLSALGRWKPPLPDSCNRERRGGGAGRLRKKPSSFRCRPSV